ncbi:MAG TPA: DinB family protein [Trueperaceae bacterium]
MSGIDFVLEAFDRNGRVNRATLATLKMDDLGHDDGAGGYTVGQHLADMAEFRYGWLTKVSPQHAESVPSVADGDQSSFWLTITSIEELQRAFDAGDAAVRAAVTSAVDEGRKFTGAYESHPVHFLEHTIVHDSHHRGQILALLRRAGRPTEERMELESKSWSIWRE